MVQPVFEPFKIATAINTLGDKDMLAFDILLFTMALEALLGLIGLTTDNFYEVA